MSRSSIVWRGAYRVIGALALILLSIWGLTPAAAADTRSPFEDRQHFVSVTRALEQSPLNPSLKADRVWALEWLVDAPEVEVTICANMMGALVRSKYRYVGEILIQNMFSMAALVIEHPETANDPNAQQMAGVEGALNAYRSILRDEPEARSAALEDLLQTQARGELAGFVRKGWIRCSERK